MRSAFKEYRAVRVLSADPDASELDGGEIWFRSDTSEWRGYDGTSFGTIGFTADA
ncbi:hypothetical protein SAMN05421858_5114 [Haladaptatus litoreus]|uniref:Uncharacterized protein n=2 Tax=Haladaptatus litoreus TaxID=553468 RepID=A0A1N7FIX2_9EURY|nr:hypothetical protein SAMN05421858_5114 [Haladaptatus litoreus]